MAGYDQTLRIKAAYREDAGHFFAFLRAVGRRYPRPVKINFRYRGRGYFYVVVDGGTGGIDALFQELILNRGLYYYACALRSKRKREILTYAVIPIFQALLEERFPNPYSRFLRRHVLGRVAQHEFVPGEFEEPFAHQYEVLCRKWDLGALDDWNFIKDLDSLLTQFLLAKLNHQSGKRSPPFAALLDLAQKTGIALADEGKAKFTNIHDARTAGLHRRATLLTNEQLSQIVMWLYSYFGFYDEFEKSQAVRTEVLHGKRYRRIRYGEEVWPQEENGDWERTTLEPCRDCAAVAGQFHAEGCDVEQCPRCKGQRLGCGCKLQKDYR